MTDPKLYNRHITIQRYNGATDEYGDVRTDIASNWVDVRSVWASIDPISGKEFYAAEQSQSKVTHKIRCRYFSGAKTEQRIKYKGRIFQIVSVINWGERSEDLMFMCEELVL